MKRKAIATLVAAAFGLPVSQVAVAQCPVPGNTATPFVAGPVNPVNGFAEYVTDAAGTSLELCLAGDGATGPCFFDPVVPGNLYSQQIGFGAEGFWWLADVAIADPSGINANFVFAAEAAWAAEIPQVGQNFPFTRLRVRLDVPQPGIYTVNHPYGSHTFDVPTVGAGDEVREVFDIPFVPNQTNQGCVAPWMISEGFPNTIAGFPGTFIGDGAPRRTTTLATVSIVGPVSASTDQFSIFGKVWDGTLNTPAATDRASYDRPALGGQAGQVDTFATSTAVGATITVTGGPNLPNGAQSLVGPDGVGRFFRSETLANAGTLPPFVTVTTSAAGSDPTVLLVPLTDVVSISKAEYNVQTGLLVVEATSSDATPAPALTVVEYTRPAGSAIATQAPVGKVTVVSSKGGKATSLVSVVNVVPPPNRPPVAQDDLVTTNEDVPVTISVLANDGDPDNDVLSITAVGTPGFGTATIVGNTIVYAPNLNFFGVDTFTYTITDVAGTNTPVTANVTVTVQAVNDAPVAVNDVISTPEDTPVTVTAATLLANDSDVDGGPLSITAVGGAVNGTVSFNATTGEITFTPGLNVINNAGFSYTVSDGAGGTATGLVSVTITGVNDAPIITSLPNTAAVAGALYSYLVQANDPDGNALTYSLPTAPLGMSINATTGLITWTPTVAGSFPVSVLVTDNGTPQLSATQNFTVVVTGAAANIDLDISALRAPTGGRVNTPLTVQLSVRNPGTVNAPRNAELIGVLNGVEVYRRSILVNDPVGGGTTTFSFPSFTPAVAGNLNWTATILDDNPDVDVATAVTRIR